MVKEFILDSLWIFVCKVFILFENHIWEFLMKKFIMMFRLWKLILSFQYRDNKRFNTKGLSNFTRSLILTTKHILWTLLISSAAIDCYLSVSYVIIPSSFQCMVQCRQRVCDELHLNVDDIQLSMGMSNDYEQAVSGFFIHPQWVCLHLREKTLSIGFSYISWFEIHIKL